MKAMNYSKAMIDLITESRRRASSEDKPNIKLANPDVLTELNKIYHKSNDTVLKAIIKEAFHLAGGRWPDRLVESLAEKMVENTAEEDTVKKPRFITKVYRGQTQLIEVS
jgi:hypothetical protein